MSYFDPAYFDAAYFASDGGTPPDEGGVRGGTRRYMPPTRVALIDHHDDDFWTVLT